MSTKEGKNVVASVLARLRNNSKSSGSPFQQVLQQYAMERFLYRISKSKHAKSVILKGALLLKTIGIPSATPILRTPNLEYALLTAPQSGDERTEGVSVIVRRLANPYLPFDGQRLAPARAAQRRDPSLRPDRLQRAV